MKNYSNIFKCIVVMIILVTTFTSTCFAAWWATPGYEWALTRKFTSIKSRNELNKSVSNEDLYDVVLRYLKYKGIKPKKIIVTKIENATSNKALSGICEKINFYIQKSELNSNQYRQVESYIDYAKKVTQEQSRLLDREDIKDINLYLDLAKYRAATLINTYEYRENVLSGIKPAKNIEILEYGIMPSMNKITRENFLIMMFELLSNQVGYTSTQTGIADGFINPMTDFDSSTTYTAAYTVSGIMEELNTEGVLLGYEDDLMLKKEMTYAEMYTFLNRFEAVSFEIISLNYIKDDGSGSTITFNGYNNNSIAYTYVSRTEDKDGNIIENALSGLAKRSGEKWIMSNSAGMVIAEMEFGINAIEIVAKVDSGEVLEGSYTSIAE